ncbi:hypothetical protein RYX36_011150 [Vicia faba]
MTNVCNMVNNVFDRTPPREEKVLPPPREQRSLPHLILFSSDHQRRATEKQLITCDKPCWRFFEGKGDPMVYPDEFDVLLKKKMAFRVKVQSNVGQASHSMFACGENEPEFNIYATSKIVNSTVSNKEDNDCDIVGSTKLSGTKPYKKVKIEPKT